MVRLKRVLFTLAIDVPYSWIYLEVKSIYTFLRVPVD